MAGFADLQALAPLGATVSVRGVAVEVRPVSLATLIGIASRFRGLQSLFSGGGVVQSILAEGDQAVAAVLAAATGGTEHDWLALIVSGRVGPVEQAALLAAVAEASLPLDETEASAVVERVAGLFGRLETLTGSDSSPASDEPDTPTPSS